MKRCSRSTLDVVIGILSIVCYIIASSYFITRFHISIEITILMVVLVVMLLLVIISGQFIIGIVKMRYKLMLPYHVTIRVTVDNIEKVS